jgi:hypothetical protein
LLFFAPFFFRKVKDALIMGKDALHRTLTVQKRKTYQPELAWGITLKSDINPAGRWSF